MMFRASKQERKPQNDKENATITPPKTTNFAFLQRKCKGFAKDAKCILYFINKEWYAALMYTTFGKIVLAMCGIAIFVTALLMFKYTKAVEYRK